MPWSEQNGPARHTKAAKTVSDKKAWSATANEVLARTGDDGEAVRIANAVVKRNKDKPRAR